MHCSWLSKNALLILGVAVSHLLVLLGLLSGSIGGEQSSLPEVIAVNLVGDKAKSSLLKKSSTTPEVNAFSNKENLSSIQAGEASSSIGADEGKGHLLGRAARQTLYSPKPHYPLASRKLREQGLVIVRLCVGGDGVVDKVDISKSSGFQGLDQSALSTLARWRFAPIAANSASLSSQCFQTPIQFTLEA